MKGRRPWHKRYHEDALNGYMGLTLEERGVYSTCLDLIYMRGAPLRFETAAEQQWVAGWLGCSPRLARSVVGSLVSKGKFRLQGGALINNRAMQELGLAEQLSEARAAAGQAGGLASAESRRGHDGEHVQPVSATNSGVENFANSSGESHELATRNNDINALAEANAKHVPEARGQRPESTGAPEFSVMQAKLAARLPRGCMWPLRNALDLKPIYACLDGGADFERHVLPAVEAEAKCAFDGGRKIGSWARFQLAIMAAVERDRMTASKSQAPGLSPEDRERAHRMTLRRYVAEPATWPPGMGPRPGEPGCIISADLLSEFNIHSAQAA
jgi:hypothetical protein